MEVSQQLRAPNAMSTSDGDDVYSDLYSTFSQVTSTTVNDIDQLPYPLTFKTALIFTGATVCGLLFGYDTGVISGVLLTINPQDISKKVITNFDKELITSITCLGSFFGSMLGFPLADKYGRRMTLAICCVVFILAAIWMGLSTTLTLLVIGRLIVGIAVGVAAQCVPVYLSEISPANIRGTILTLNSVAITGGQLLSYIASYLLASLNHSWRYLFGLSAIPAIIFILLLDFIPESPRWLISNGEFPKAQEALKKIYPTATPQQVSLKLRRLIVDLNKLRKYQDIEEPLLAPRSCSFLKYINAPFLTEVPEEPPVDQVNSSSFSSSSYSNQTPAHPAKVKHIHRMEPRARRALLVGCILMFFQQATGFNAFMYYATIIFAELKVQDPLVPAITVALTNFLFTFVALRLVDSVGRRSMLLHTIWIMTVGLLLGSIGFSNENSTFVLLSVLIFVAAYASAMGTIPWSSVEFLPLNRRSFGGACISCTNWLTNTFVSMSYLSIMTRFGNKNTMLIFALFTVLNWLFVYFWYPEVNGLTLEEIGKVFENGIDVHYVYRNYH